MSADDGPGRREVAYRVFAAEFDDVTLSYSESDEERAPNYVVTPTGLRVNRLFAVGVLTEVEDVNEDVLRGRVVDPTGAFVTYAGQYQPDEAAFLDRTTPPAFVALTGKARTFEPEDSDVVYSSLRPESINDVDADTRDRWTVSTAESTLQRLAVFAAAMASDRRGDDLERALRERGVAPPLAAGIPRALDHYGTTPAYVEAVRRLAVDALEVVAGEREEVRSLDVAPNEGGVTDVGTLPPAPFDPDALAADEPADGAAETPDARDADAPEPQAATAVASEGATEPEGTADDGATTEPSTTSVSATDASETDPSDAETTTAEGADVESTSTEPATADESSAESTTAEPATGATSAGSEDAGTTAAEAESAASAAAEPTSEDSTDTDPETASTASSESETDDSLGDFDDASADAAGGSSETVEGESSGGDDGLGDFEDAGGDEGVGTDADEGATADADETPESEADAASDGLYELDDEERQEVESEFGTEFATGSEVDAPGEAGIDVPDADELADQADAATGSGEGAAADASTEPADESVETESAADEGAEVDAASTPETESAPEVETQPADESVETESAADDTGSDDAATAPDDADLEDVVVDVMTDLDDGDGADRDAVVEAVVDRTGADPDAVDDAIQDALMSGKCYEPGEGTLKAI